MSMQYHRFSRITLTLWCGAGKSASILQCARHIYTDTKHTNTHTHTPASVSKPQNLTWRNQLSNTAKNVLNQALVHFHVDSTSDALLEWEDQEQSLGQSLKFLRFIMCPLLSFFPQLSHFTCQKAHSLLKIFMVPARALLGISDRLSEQYTALAFNNQMPTWQAVKSRGL